MDNPAASTKMFLLLDIHDALSINKLLAYIM